MVSGEHEPDHHAGDLAARQLANATKTVPQMGTITPRWLVRLLPWIGVEAGIYRLNAHTLQHPEIHGKTNNAAHLVWLCWVFEFGGDTNAPSGPPWWRRARRGEVVELAAPTARGALTVADVARATDPAEYLALTEAWARTVYAAWHAHHGWAKRAVERQWSP